ncbi:MAG: bifunctional adenosylcobinamide kinase/adenosylcobinamide-phosphate guanylyltransferase [Chloroflexi bacterium]|jgi:adenosylcobinamide kinase/adenosylcobinamide-phosphate guanylyltransferase|nr:bifunctional adenosylcobinamide kinase/adenosylcobinamide-phosphate guanylyltransferase [Chloroflexota bacterium]
MGEMMLILGGARSGKSSYAQRLAHELGGGRVLFVATAEAGDEEMQARIADHRRSRPAGWRTVEAPRNVAQAIAPAIQDARVVLVDCITLLTSNVLLAGGESPDAQQAERDVVQEIDALCALARHEAATFILVSNEVGLGLVPVYELGRLYRDVLGRANQILATQADQVVLLIAGLPVELKALQAAIAKGAGISTP